MRNLEVMDIIMWLMLVADITRAVIGQLRDIILP